MVLFVTINNPQVSFVAAVRQVTSFWEIGKLACVIAPVSYFSVCHYIPFFLLVSFACVAYVIYTTDRVISFFTTHANHGVYKIYFAHFVNSQSLLVLLGVSSPSDRHKLVDWLVPIA